MAASHSIVFKYEARYFTLGEQENPKEIWFVLHGYGQLAEFFIRKFNQLGEANHLIIAPEGLSKFYLEGFSGRVGATWMTKENRHTEIKNHLEYLNNVYSQIRSQYPTELKINILGFSQGSATATRWVLDKVVTYDRLILWAGIFPKDMDINLGQTQLTNKEVYFIYGDQDPFITPDRILDQEMLTQSLGLKPTTLTFSGKHEIADVGLMMLTNSFSL